MKISETFSMLISAYDDWHRCLLNPNFFRSGNRISWNSYESNWIDESLTYDSFMELVSTKQYSFQVQDGSIIQLYYEFDSNGDELIKANLAYCRNIFRNQLDDETSEEDLLSSQYNDAVQWLRIDYAPDMDRGVIHCAAHMHLSSFPQGRMIMRGVPTPKQFIEFIISLCYPELYSKHRLDGVGEFVNFSKVVAVNSSKFAMLDKTYFSHLVHLNSP